MSCFTSDPVAAYHMDCDARDANTERPAPAKTVADLPYPVVDQIAFRRAARNLAARLGGAETRNHGGPILSHELSHEHDECGDCADCIAERVRIREQVIAALRDLAEERKEECPKN